MSPSCLLSAPFLIASKPRSWAFPALLSCEAGILVHFTNEADLDLSDSCFYAHSMPLWTAY